MFEKYIAYLKDNPEGYWFKRKLYGWGWTPATREGWMATIGFVLVLVFLAATSDEPAATSLDAFMMLAAPFVVATIIFLIVCYQKGESPRWQWGIKKDEK
ncbi:MAG: hypothetical protein M0P64_01935 [Candidatus Pacebacteria bacterium]|jgi:hypothetical protein|nr:hypothetical protein [Candidatus Paceibacterota bacterium]